jgi:sec-independent protein translocase protein TatC
MCLFASPMLFLYFLGVGVAYFVHPNRRKAREATTA